MQSEPVVLNGYVVYVRYTVFDDGQIDWKLGPEESTDNPLFEYMLRHFCNDRIITHLRYAHQARTYAENEAFAKAVDDDLPF